MPDELRLGQRLGRKVSRLFADIANPDVTGNRISGTALIGLLVIWGALMSLTWATWGNLTSDCGREMYVPTVLSEGKMLYRDVWYSYGPAAPYFNSLLFRIFGVHLSILYWAGSLSALGCAVFLYLVGIRLGSPIIGWTVGAAVLTQAFAVGLFCFPLPYSFASVYGYLTACCYLWLVVSACTSVGKVWVFWAGTCAAIALLLKTEYGFACYLTLALLVGARWIQRRSWRFTLGEIFAILPGVLLCLMVIHWMISIRGIQFILDENLASAGTSFPGSYFMKTYGRVWLEKFGLTLSVAAFAQAAIRLSVLGACVIAFRRVLHRVLPNKNGTWVFFGAELCVLVVGLFIRNLPGPAQAFFRSIFFPMDMVLVVALAAIPAWWYIFRNDTERRNIAIPLLLTFASLLGSRVLMRMQPSYYAIYCNGPAILSFLLLLSRVLIPRKYRSGPRQAVVPITVFIGAIAFGVLMTIGPSFPASYLVRGVIFVLLVLGLTRVRRKAFSDLLYQAEVLTCFNVLLPIALYAGPFVFFGTGLEPLTSDRGTVRVSRHLAENYRSAIAFMREKDTLGQTVLSIPEDSSLYFFSATHCPIRLIAFTPGVLTPGRMTDDLIHDVEMKHIDYLLWSNRKFTEYGVTTFGSDFDGVFGDYLRAHYRPIGPLIPDNGPGWDAVIWERLPYDGASATYREQKTFSVGRASR